MHIGIRDDDHNDDDGDDDDDDVDDDDAQTAVPSVMNIFIIIIYIKSTAIFIAYRLLPWNIFTLMVCINILFDTHICF